MVGKDELFTKIAKAPLNFVYNNELKARIFKIETTLRKVFLKN